MKTNGSIIGWFIIVTVALFIIGSSVYRVDPYFHYHMPNTDNYYYALDNQRSQNDGIIKHFEYNALITGTSMTENFLTSELDEIFGVNSIKVSYSGGSYKEMNDSLKNAFKYNPDLKLIVRGLDTNKFFDTADEMRNDLGSYPTYLYDENPFNDVNYLFNKDVIFYRVYAMEEGSNEGITSFDDYSRWQDDYTYGINTVAPDRVSFDGVGEPVHLTDEKKESIRESITQNVTALADEYPEVDFYYFMTPYSILSYKDSVGDGTIYCQVEAEQYIIELILEHENIKLFSFNGVEEYVTDLNNYKDLNHYAQWINSYMLRCMYEGKYRLTKDNYEEYLEKELSLFTGYDYLSLNEQADYKNDFYAAALINEKVWGVKPIDILSKGASSVELSNAEIVDEQYEGSQGIRCVGKLQRESNCEMDASDYIQSNEFVGAKISIDSIDKHKYLVFYGRKVVNHAQPTVVVLNDNNERVGEVAESYHDLDNEWRQYLIDLSSVEGGITIYFNGGYIDSTGSLESEYIFSDIKLY